MKKLMSNVLLGILGLYIISLSVVTPYYNWQYAKEHGFIKWVLFGEIVATMKSTIWPYYAFASSSRSSDSPDSRHYDNSKKACDEALKIVIKTGDPTRLSVADKTKVADLLELSLSEANQVKPSYLTKVHPKFQDMYERNYKVAINMMVTGYRTDNTQLVLGGSYGYNEFAAWMEKHANDLSF